MITVRVFDPAMCCSTGVCGPSVDSRLASFAADLDWLKSQGVPVERINLAQRPGAFAENQAVRSVLETRGEAGLPLVEVNGEIRSSGVYPTRAELADWAGLSVSAPAKLASVPIVLRPISGSCCAPAATDPSDAHALAKGGSCC